MTRKLIPLADHPKRQIRHRWASCLSVNQSHNRTHVRTIRLRQQRSTLQTYIVTVSNNSYITVAEIVEHRLENQVLMQFLVGHKQPSRVELIKHVFYFVRKDEQRMISSLQIEFQSMRNVVAGDCIRSGEIEE